MKYYLIKAELEPQASTTLLYTNNFINQKTYNFVCNDYVELTEEEVEELITGLSWEQDQWYSGGMKMNEEELSAIQDKIRKVLDNE